MTSSEQHLLTSNSICFLNMNELTNDEIISLFSRYGDVEKLRTTGGSYGHRIVYYSSPDKATRAFAGLKDRPGIRFCREYSGDSSTNDQSNLDLEDLDSQLEYASYESTDSLLDDKDSQLVKYQRKANLNIRDLSMALCEPNMLSYMKYTVNVTDDQVPNLVNWDPRLGPRSINSKVILQAADLVVGNIADGYTEAYLLHLFESYKPLAIMGIKTILGPKPIRYCHVYFEKKEQANRVERMFDGFLLRDKHLVVMKPATLLSLYKY